MSATIYTIGYQGRTLEELLASAREHKAMLIDVRIRPASRNPDFSRARLSARCGLAYRHVPELGNVNYKGGPIRLANAAAGVRLLTPLILSGQNLMLLCVCQEWETCHRRQVADAIKAKFPECPIKHLEAARLQ